MEKYIKGNWFKLLLSIFALILLAMLLRNQNELNQIKKQNHDLQTSQQAYNLPTATEVFRLRSECVVLGQKTLDSNTIGSVLTQSQISHYNPATNRCYVQLTVQSANLSGDYFSNYLFDGQTGDLLASATKEKGKNDRGVILSGPAETNKPDPSEGVFAATNDYINEVMKDDWKQ